MSWQHTALVVTATALLSACTAAQPAPPAPQGAPRAAGGKPDFTGIWAGPGFVHTGKDTDTANVRLYTNANMAPFTPGGRERLYRKHAGNVRVDDPTAICLPNGLTRQIPSPYAQQWIQTPTQLVILYEYMHFFRVIPFGAPNRPHADDIEPTYMGDSIAWWEDDTLVIDTVGLNEWMLDAFHPDDGGSRWHSDRLHVVERLRYTDSTNASYDVTIDDPAIFEKPWVERWAMQIKPTWKILEFICDDNDRCRTGNCTDADVQKSAGSQ
ncbi:MAG: hypothetical protein HY824_14370 [Acidobacteria bacterium]|nr:hypothetical protein [Acidobacteriota bacterium]